MCILALIKKPTESLKLVILGNRDEFYERPSESAHWWSGEGVFGGRDQSKGGTWLGVTKAGRYAAILNFRDPSLINEEAASRGTIVKDFLESDVSPMDYISQLRGKRADYNPFTVLVGDLKQDVHMVFNSVSGQVKNLGEKATVLSNGHIDALWPKQKRLIELLNEVKVEGGDATELFALLKDSWRPSDGELPSTGITLEQERAVSPVFVESPAYGTCSSYVITVDIENRVTFYERQHGSLSKGAEVKMSWNVN